MRKKQLRADMTAHDMGEPGSRVNEPGSRDNDPGSRDRSRDLSGAGNNLAAIAEDRV